MTDLAARVFAPPLLERDDFGFAGLLKNFGRHGGAGNGRRAERKVVAAHHQDLAKLDDLAGLALYFTDFDHILGGYSILLAARFEDREHLSSSAKPRPKPRWSGDGPDRIVQSMLLTVRGLVAQRYRMRRPAPL